MAAGPDQVWNVSQAWRQTAHGFSSGQQKDRHNDRGKKGGVCNRVFLKLFYVLSFPLGYLKTAQKMVQSSKNAEKWSKPFGHLSEMPVCPCHPLRPSSDNEAIYYMSRPGGGWQDNVCHQGTPFAGSTSVLFGVIWRRTFDTNLTIFLRKYRTHW